MSAALLLGGRLGGVASPAQGGTGGDGTTTGAGANVLANGPTLSGPLLAAHPNTSGVSGTGAAGYEGVDAYFVWNTPPQAQQSTNTTAGGNARGAGAVDWQYATRTAAAQAATGTNSVISGGVTNTASGGASVVAGGELNGVTASWGSIGGGYANSVFGQWGTVAGGRENGTGSGLGSWCPGGQQGEGRGLVNRGFWAATKFASNGDAQAGEFVLKRSTTDATATRLTADNAAPGSANTVNLPNNSAYMLTIMLVGIQTGGSAGTVGDTFGGVYHVRVKRGANAAATVVSTVATAFSNADTGAAGWGFSVSADTTNGGPAFTVAGEVNKTIRWVARVLSVEVTA